ncbi:MAG TPA: flagellar biosynthesis protein FlhA [Egibacteraceae bacterium]|nr:flagellar biosynthesis protein FlhA [Egibacteraceae bacterium]
MPGAAASAAARVTRAMVPLLLVAAVLMMVVPVPAVGLDLLLAANITLAVVVLLVVMTLRDSLELSVFPSLLLITTLLRLALNVSSTRLILLEGYAGKIIDTFGNFVVGGSVVVGLVVFLILIVIQFVVITNGAGRVAEVGARFALDGMPGKQMAIDADLSAGLIAEEEARDRRERIAKEADFYGAMDGASKFVKGDAIAGIIIVAINLIGGFAIGTTTRGLSLGESISVYSLLTVGDGLVSQIPALLMSISTGLLVTRVGRDADLGPLLGVQLFSNRRALRLAAGVVAGLALLPGLPKIPFFVLAGGLVALSGRAGADGEEPPRADDVLITPAPDDPEALVAQMRVEPLELHLSYDVLDLIDPAQGGDLLERVRALRQQIALDLGVVLPFVRTRDDVSLPPATYRILLHGVEVARGTAPRDRALALPAGDGSEFAGLAGEQTREPVFGLTAFWIPDGARATAAASGATVVDRSSVIVTHLAEVARGSAAELLSRQQVQLLVEGLRADEPLLAGEVGSESLPLATLHAVLRGLLAERVPIRDLPRIVEAVSARSREGRSVEQLVAAARAAIGSAIVARIAPARRLSVATLDPGLESALHEALRDLDGTLHLAVDPERLGILVEGAQGLLAGGEQPVALVCGQLLRRPLQATLAGSGVELPVLAYPELPPTLDLIPIGVIGHAPVDA